jgi:hypothetical protein
MVTERFCICVTVCSCATVDCICNVHEFMSTGEGWELTRLEDMHIE